MTILQMNVSGQRVTRFALFALFVATGCVDGTPAGLPRVRDHDVGMSSLAQSAADVIGADIDTAVLRATIEATDEVLEQSLTASQGVAHVVFKNPESMGNLASAG